MFDEVVTLGKVDGVDELFQPDFTTASPSRQTFDRDAPRTSWSPDMGCSPAYCVPVAFLLRAAW